MCNPQYVHRPGVVIGNPPVKANHAFLASVSVCGLGQSRCRMYAAASAFSASDGSPMNGLVILFGSLLPRRFVGLLEALNEIFGVEEFRVRLAFEYLGFQIVFYVLFSGPPSVSPR